MTARRYRGGILLPLILIAGGILFLLSNLGLVELASWRTILRLWPILLIAVGVDLVVARSSLAGALSSLVTVCVLLGVGFAAFYLFAPGAWTAREQGVHVPLAGASAGNVALACDACTIRIVGGASADAIVEGTVVGSPWATLSQSTDRTNGVVSYALAGRSALRLPFPRFGGATWQFALSDDVPIELSVHADGADLDLTDMDLVRVDLDAGERAGRLLLSARSSATYDLSGDALTVVVPDGVGVLADSEAVGAIDAPSDYVQSGSRSVSPDFDLASVRATIVVGAGSHISITAEAEPTEASRPAD